MRKLILINAVVWAGMILLASYLFKDHPNYQYFFFALILGASLMNGFLATKLAKNKQGGCK